MNDHQDTLSYHSRRSIDELASALASIDDAAAQAHKELSLLHLERFVAIMTVATQRLHRHQLLPVRNALDG